MDEQIITPFILQQAYLRNLNDKIVDEPTSDDQTLNSLRVITHNAHRGTRVTLIKQETTDDE